MNSWKRLQVTYTVNKMAKTFKDNKKAKLDRATNRSIEGPKKPKMKPYHRSTKIKDEY